MFYHGQESEFLHTEVLRVCVLSWAIESEVFHTEVLRVCVLSWTIVSFCGQSQACFCMEPTVLLMNAVILFSSLYHFTEVVSILA